VNRRTRYAGEASPNLGTRRRLHRRLAGGWDSAERKGMNLVDPDDRRSHRTSTSDLKGGKQVDRLSWSTKGGDVLCAVHSAGTSRVGDNAQRTPQGLSRSRMSARDAIRPVGVAACAIEHGGGSATGAAVLRPITCRAQPPATGFAS
jgi:hypothetical protein